MKRLGKGYRDCFKFKQDLKTILHQIALSYYTANQLFKINSTIIQLQFHESSSKNIASLNPQSRPHHTISRHS